MEIGQWNGHVFEVSPTVIRGFTGLTIKGSSDTEEKETSGQKYVSRKAGKPIEAALTVELSAFTGCNVREEALAFAVDARNGAQDYFYVGSQKLVTCQLMLTDASVEETEIGTGGTWTHCKVKLTLKQATKNDGTVSSESPGSNSGAAGTAAKKASVKTTPITTATGSGTDGKAAAPGTRNVAATSSTSIFGKAIAAVTATVNEAKAASAKAVSMVKSVSTMKLKTLGK